MEYSYFLCLRTVFLSNYGSALSRYIWLSFLSWRSMHFWQPNSKKDMGNMTGAAIKDMILSQDLIKLWLVFYICFHFIIFKKKKTNKTNRKATLEFNSLCVYSAWDTDCWCKQYKCSVSALLFVWTSASDWQRELISKRYKSSFLLNQI